LAEEQEAQLLAELERGQKKLAGAKEISQGTVYTESLRTTWRPPKFIRDMSDMDHDIVRSENHIITEGLRIPPPITNFTVSILGLCSTGD
jgi:ATP-dependent RNA helicase DDX41